MWPSGAVGVRGAQVAEDSGLGPRSGSGVAATSPADLLAEAMALIAVTVNHPHLLYGSDVWGFIDNEAAASAAIRAGAEADVVTAIVQTAHLLWAELRCRVWVEWIDSNSNPSDGLSRKGLVDPWTVRQGWELREAWQPPWRGHSHTPNQLAGTMFQHWGLE